MQSSTYPTILQIFSPRFKNARSAQLAPLLCPLPCHTRYQPHSGRLGLHQSKRPPFYSAHALLKLFWHKHFNSGDVKGTIPDAVRYHFVSNDVRRHRLISISYISLLPCHGSDASPTGASVRMRSNRWRSDLQRVAIGAEKLPSRK